MNQIMSQRHRDHILCAVPVKGWLKAAKHNIMASLSRIYAFDVKPFHTHWYRRPGNLVDPYSLSVIPNGYNIEEACPSCFMERVVHRRFSAHYVCDRG